jgi:predicted DCC family thiol-disulfide oxidoreductase YuxK
VEPARQQLIWDGECDFCDRAVVWVGRHDRGGLIDPVPSQRLGLGRLPALRVVGADGRTEDGARACLVVLSAIGHDGTARVLARRPLLWAVEAGYRVAARTRRWL